MVLNPQSNHLDKNKDSSRLRHMTRASYYFDTGNSNANFFPLFVSSSTFSQAPLLCIFTTYNAYSYVEHYVPSAAIVVAVTPSISPRCLTTLVQSGCCYSYKESANKSQFKNCMGVAYLSFLFSR